MHSRTSSLVLILANLLPIGGVVWFGWSALEVLLLYWTESVAIGVINVLRMASIESDNLFAGYVAPDGEARSSALLQTAGALLPMNGIKAFVIPFFMIHYGMFCFGHISIVTSIFAVSGTTPGSFGALPGASDTGFWIVVAAIFFSHLFSYFVNFIGKGEYRRTGLMTLMMRPYGRIMAMHITVVVGAGLTMVLADPLPMLVVLVVMKTAIDLKMHNGERSRFAVET